MNEKFKPTTEWMESAYNKLNAQLFNNELRSCILRPFTTGQGSRGNTLGWFKITSKDIRIKKYNRKLYSTYFGEEVFYDNFVELCKPCIELNANYSWTEDVMLATLAHEMCHYYTYMNGYCPKQGHGPEFRQIGQIVSDRSNGMFTIQRLADAEQMKNMELDASIQASNQARLDRKKQSIGAVFVLNNNGTIELTTTSSPKVVDFIVEQNSSSSESGERFNIAQRGLPTCIIYSNDINLIEDLFTKGYRKNMRSYRFWNIEHKFSIENITSFNYKILWKSNDFDINTISQNEQPKEPEKKRYFCIKLKNGEIFKTDGMNYTSLKNAISQRFPNWSDSAIENLINNPKNYIMENKTLSNIVESVINEFINNETLEDSIPLDPNMNLGLESPLEMEY